MSEQTDYWLEHFARCAKEGDESYDSDSPLMVSMYGLTLHLLGTAAFEGTVIDVGCGAGKFSEMVSSLGATAVAIDGKYSIERNMYRSGSTVEWIGIDSLEDEWHVKPAEAVVCLETLQFVDMTTVLERLWAHVKPGGRLIFTVPNMSNGINAEGNREHRGMFGAVTTSALNSLVRSVCKGYETWKVYGLHLGLDQRIESYDSSKLTVIDSPAPYRFLVAVIRS